MFLLTYEDSITDIELPLATSTNIKKLCKFALNDFKSYYDEDTSRFDLGLVIEKGTNTLLASYKIAKIKEIK